LCLIIIDVESRKNILKRMMKVTEKVLELKNVAKKRGKTQVLKDINFSVNKGEVCGFVGRNGAGKTTLIKIITSMLFLDEGEVIICGKNLKTEREGALKNVGAVVETPEMYGYMTGRQNLNYIASVLENVTKDEIEDVIKFSDLGIKIDEKVKKYSLGMKQRLGLSQAIMGNVSLLILDEPTNGLDPMGVVELKNTINTLVKEKGVSVFISSHILSEIENICTKVVFIDDGKIISVQEIGDKAKVSNVKNMFIKTNLPQRTSEIIENIHDVKLLKLENEGVSILINTDLCHIFEILKNLHEEGIDVEGFFEIKENLEDKFVKMMGEDSNE
jgi:ABC-2 type transport system ATP-binding protein